MNAHASQIANVAVHYDIHDFINGQRDCMGGVGHVAGKSESYDKGYAAQYELEQVNSYNSIRGQQNGNSCIDYR